jgi:hypothetical protein
MKPLKDLTDDEIDSLLLSLFGQSPPSGMPVVPERIEDKSDADLRRIRSRNHPDKWPNVDLEAFKAATEEIDRRRLRAPKANRR